MNSLPEKTNLVSWNNEMYLKHSAVYAYNHWLIGRITAKRVELIKKMAEIKKRDKVIEVGCEAGELLYRLPKSEFSVGLDISSKALEDAKKKGMKNVSFIQCDVTKGLPLKEGIFDVIICADNLEHVTEPAKVVENIYHLSKQDTRIIFSVPNETLFLKIKFLLRWLRLSSLILKNIEGKK